MEHPWKSASNRRVLVQFRGDVPLTATTIDFSAPEVLGGEVPSEKHLAPFKKALKRFLSGHFTCFFHRFEGVRGYFTRSFNVSDAFEVRVDFQSPELSETIRREARRLGRGALPLSDAGRAAAAAGREVPRLPRLLRRGARHLRGVCWLLLARGQRELQGLR